MRFNQTKSALTRTVNHAGGEAFAQSPKLELASLLLTSFVKEQYYRGAGEQINQVRKLIAGGADMPVFAAKAAVYARNAFGMRSITHAVAGEVAATACGERWTRRFFTKVARRPDDVTEILAYFMKTRQLKPTNAMKRGLGDALAQFDAYQLAKYRANGAAVSLVDAVNLCHPPHTDALAALVKGHARQRRHLGEPAVPRGPGG